MRVRVRSINPLPTVKAWYEVSTGTLDQRNIAGLKAEFCQTLFNAHKPPLTQENIVIELEDFELLDSSSLNVVRENDLLIVKYKAIQLAGMKRKREAQDEISALVKQKNKKRPRSSSSSSSSPSSSSSDSSSSSSSGSSSSSSSSSSDSDSDTDTLPSTILSKAIVQKNTTSKHPHPHQGAQTLLSLFPVYPRQPVPKTNGRTKEQKYITLKVQDGTSKDQNGTSQKQSITFVPPGEGKPSTQQRNQRRRKRRMAEKDGLGRGQEQQQKDGEQEQETEAIPSSTSASADLALADSMTRVTKNDNKRRGFKGRAGGDGVASSSSKHQTFIIDISSSSSPLKSSSSPLKSSLPRLIPPSERTDLPGNIIVSSVDVEAGEWDQPRTKTGSTYIEGSDRDERQGKPEWERKWTAGEGEFVATQREARVQLGSGHSFATWDWDEIEKGWEGYRELESGAPVEAGMVLLWKELALHPVSFTPEVMVQAGTVESVHEEGVELKMISRVELDGMEEEFEEEGEVVSRKRGELTGYRLYSQ